MVILLMGHFVRQTFNSLQTFLPKNNILCLSLAQYLNVFSYDCIILSFWVKFVPI